MVIYQFDSYIKRGREGNASNDVSNITEKAKNIGKNLTEVAKKLGETINKKMKDLAK